MQEVCGRVGVWVGGYVGGRMGHCSGGWIDAVSFTSSPTFDKMVDNPPQVDAISEFSIFPLAVGVPVRIRVRV